MELCSERLLEAFSERLGQLGPPSEESEGVHVQYLADLRFAAAPLELHLPWVQEGIERLQHRLTSAFAGFLAPWLEEKAAKLVQDFEATAHNNQDDYKGDLQKAAALYERLAERVGGRPAAELRAAFSRKLARIVSARLSKDRQELLRHRALLWEEAERIAAATAASADEVEFAGSRRELEGVARRFAELADRYGGQQAACFKQSFEESMRRSGFLDLAPASAPAAEAAPHTLTTHTPCVLHLSQLPAAEKAAAPPPAALRPQGLAAEDPVESDPIEV